MNIGTNAHLLYHVVFATKNRARMLIEPYRESLYKYMAGVIKQKGGLPVLINGMEDHVHVLAFLPKHISISEMIQAIKGSSSYWFNKEFSSQGRHLYWQDGYSVFTVSPTSLEAVKNYIFNQDVHHQSKDYQSELEEFEQELRKHFNPDQINTILPGS